MRVAEHDARVRVASRGARNAFEEHDGVVEPTGAHAVDREQVGELVANGLQRRIVEHRRVVRADHLEDLTIADHADARRAT